MVCVLAYFMTAIQSSLFGKELTAGRKLFFAVALFAVPAATAAVRSRLPVARRRRTRPAGKLNHSCCSLDPTLLTDPCRDAATLSPRHGRAPLFVLGLLVGAFGVGFLVARERVFPYDQLSGAQEALIGAYRAYLKPPPFNRPGGPEVVEGVAWTSRRGCSPG